MKIYVVILISFLLSNIMFYLLGFKKNKNVKKSIAELYKSKLSIFEIAVFVVINSFLYHYTDNLKMFFIRTTLISLLFLISIIDIRKKIIHDSILYILFILGIVNMFINKNMNHKTCLISFVVIGILMVAISKITKGGMGLGDAKLLAILALWLDMYGIISVCLLASFLTGFVGAIFLIIDIKNKNREIPFSPFISIAVFLVFIMS
ncbi:MAG: prepilin peptidase [Clostridiaceae bacterium]